VRKADYLTVGQDEWGCIVKTSYVKTKYLVKYLTKCTRSPTLWMSVVVAYTFLDSSVLWFWRKTRKSTGPIVSKNEEVIQRAKEERNILQGMKWRYADFICYVLCSICLLKGFTEWKIKGMGRRSSRPKQLLGDLKVKWRYCNLQV